jgi:crossover junction endodeoxyribonuclease RusA
MTTDTTPPVTGEWLVVFPQPAPLLNMNQRLHWSTERARARAWRAAARFSLGHGPASPAGPCPPSVVQIGLPVVGTRRRDPHNYFPTVKHIVDGLVDAGLWPDDTPTYVTTVEPTLVPHARSTSRLPVTVRITPRGDGAS